MDINTKDKGVTLITLVITIIILLILAGIAVTQLSENGLFAKAKLAKERTEYISAKEILEIKLMEIQTDCIYEGKDYTLKEIASSIKIDTKITIEKYYNGNIALIKDGIEENLIDLQGIIVSVNDYSKYKFLIGKSCEIEKITTENVTDSTDIKDLQIIEDYENNLFGKDPNIGTDSEDEEKDIPSVGEDVDITNPIEITTYMSIRSNTKNTLNLSGVENIKYVIQEKTSNVNLSGNILTANNNADSKDSCKIQITGTFSGQSYTNNLIVYVEPKNTTTIEGNEYYRIYTVNDLIRLSELTNHNVGSIQNAIMMNDIDLDGVNWQPIGYEEYDEDGNVISMASFNGIFDGQNYTIKNMKINIDDINHSGIAFIGRVENGVIKRLKFDNPDVYSNGSSVAIAVGVGVNNSTIEKIQVLNGKVNGTESTAGICANITNQCTIKYCFNNASVIGTGGSGGICGWVDMDCNIFSCYNSGTLNITDESPTYGSAGIVGKTYFTSTVQYCYNIGEITNNSTGTSIGGIVGYNGSNNVTSLQRSSIMNCYNFANVQSKGARSGGIAGSNSQYGKVLNCYSSKNSVITGTSYTSQIVGWQHGSVSNSTVLESMPSVYSVLIQYEEKDEQDNLIESPWKDSDDNRPKLKE